jgi:membrane-associated protein
MIGMSTIAALGLAGLGLAIFAETGLFIGVVLPGDTLLFSFGILASLGKVSLIGSIVVASIAAYAGYDLAYRLGKKYGEKVFSKSGSSIFSKKNLERSKNYFSKFGVVTLLFARFIPGVRVVAGAMAGASHMEKWTFVRYNLLGAILWPVIGILLGFYFGNSIENPDRFILPIIGAVVVLTFLVPLTIKLFRKK